MYSWQNEDRHGALFAPPEVLAPGDVSHFQVTVLAALDTQQRSVEVANPADLAEVTLLPRIESGTPHEGGVGMTWTAISDFYTTATVATSSSRSVQRVTASRSWLERHGKNELDFDLAVDGYDASWTVQLPLSVELARWNQGRVSSTSYRPVEAM
jgi:hypothetical protein